MATLDLKEPAGPLERFGSCLGVPRSAWAGEALDEMAAPPETTITIGGLSRCRESVLELVEAYGGALKSPDGWSKIKGLEDDLELRPGLTDDDLTSFLAQFEESLDHPEELEGFRTTLILRLNKRKLLEDHLPDLPEDVRPALFFYEKGLVDLLEGGLSILESWWDRGTPQRLVLFVPAWGHFLEGPLLAIVGGDPVAGLDRLKASPSKTPGSSPEREQ